MKATNLWIIKLEDKRKFEIACKKLKTAIDKIKKYYLANGEVLVPSHTKDRLAPLYPDKKVIGFTADMRGILTI